MRSSVFVILAIALLQAGCANGDPPYKLVAQLPAGDGGWDLASVSPQDQRLYVARSDGVTAFDLKTGRATDRLVPGQRVHSALAIPGTHDVLATNGDTNNAVLFDGLTGKVRATIPTGAKPDAAAYDPATGTVWIMNPDSGDMTVVDPTTAKVVATVPVGGSLELAIADGNGRLYANIEDKNEVAIVDTRAHRVVARFPLQGCDEPSGIAYDPTSRELVSACGNGVAIVSGTDGRQLAKLTIGKGADGAAIDARRKVALVPAGHDGNLTVIALGASPRVLGQVATAVSARTIALDADSGRVYLPSAKLAPAEGAARPKPVPGTFRVLVLEPQKNRPSAP